MTLRDCLNDQILKLIDEKIIGTGVPLEDFVEEALLTKLSAPSHRTLKVKTLIRIWDTAEKYGDDQQFKNRFFHFHFGIKIHKSDDPEPWDESHPFLGPSPRLESKKFIEELIDLRRPKSTTPKPEKPDRIDFWLD